MWTHTHWQRVLCRNVREPFPRPGPGSWNSTLFFLLRSQTKTTTKPLLHRSTYHSLVLCRIVVTEQRQFLKSPKPKLTWLKLRHGYNCSTTVCRKGCLSHSVVAVSSLFILSLNFFSWTLHGYDVFARWKRHFWKFTRQILFQFEVAPRLPNYRACCSLVTHLCLRGDGEQGGAEFDYTPLTPFHDVPFRPTN